MNTISDADRASMERWLEDASSLIENARSIIDGTRRPTEWKPTYDEDDYAHDVVSGINVSRDGVPWIQFPKHAVDDMRLSSVDVRVLLAVYRYGSDAAAIAAALGMTEAEVERIGDVLYDVGYLFDEEPAAT